MKTALLTITLAASLFGRACIHDPHDPGHGCSNPPPISDVPEPSTFLLSGTALIGVGLMLRKKK